MSTFDDRNRPQGQQAQQPQQGQQGSQQEAQQGGQVRQQGGGAQQGSQQEQFSPGRAQQGSPAVRRAGTGMPSIFGAGRSNPFEMLRRLDQDMDRLFNQLWTGRSTPVARGAEVPSMWAPQVEMCEREGKLHVYADLPGLRKEDVKVSLEGDQLVLQGERRSAQEENQQGIFHSERTYGSFYRSIPLPEGVDPATVDASFRDGVLDVCFDAPRSQQEQARRIEIRDGNP